MESNRPLLRPNRPIGMASDRPVSVGYRPSPQSTPSPQSLGRPQPVGQPGRPLGAVPQSVGAGPISRPVGPLGARPSGSYPTPGYPTQPGLSGQPPAQYANSNGYPPQQSTAYPPQQFATYLPRPLQSQQPSSMYTQPTGQFPPSQTGPYPPTQAGQFPPTQTGQSNQAQFQQPSNQGQFQPPVPNQGQFQQPLPNQGGQFQPPIPNQAQFQQQPNQGQFQQTGPYPIQNGMLNGQYSQSNGMNGGNQFNGPALSTPYVPPAFGAPRPNSNNQMPPSMATNMGSNYSPIDPGNQFGPSQSQTQPNPNSSRQKIDPDQIPSPVIVHEADQAIALTGPYNTMSRVMPPLASVHFRAVDDGICNPRFIRSTIYQFPLTEAMLNTSHLPFGLIIQPLAELSYEEVPVPVVDFGQAGPVRCGRCKAYINPFFQFIAGGRKFSCNLCNMENDVPESYFANLDMNGRRVDVYERPELMYGSCDFEVQGGYNSKPPTPASYLFLIDVSLPSIQSGLLATCAAALKYFLFASGSGLPVGAKFGIMTFDKVIHFYNLSPELESAQMMVVGDIDEGFVPIRNGLFVDPNESKALIEGLLDNLPNIFANTAETVSAPGSACQMAYLALKPVGGKLSVFHTSLPTYGQGILKDREDVKILGTEKERSLYEPQDFFWKKLGQDCASGGICVDSYFFKRGYMDIATVGTLSSLSGGDTYLYNNFNASVHGAKFGNDMQTALCRPFGYDALLRVRVSNNLKVSEYMGNFHMQSALDVDMGGIDSLKAIGVLLKHDGKLDEKLDSSIQMALLYTTATGKRRVRVHNMTFPNTNQLANLFRNAEIDTSINLFVKAAVQQSFVTPLKVVRDQFSTRCVKLLTSYRVHCAAASSPGQLILPESFKLFPLYSVCMLKSRAFRFGTIIPSDLRVYTMRLFNSIGVEECSVYIYPKIYNLTTLDADVGTLDERSLMTLPPIMRCSSERLMTSGVFLAENGRHLFLWVGPEVPRQTLLHLFGVDNLASVDSTVHSLAEFENSYSIAVRKVIEYVTARRSRYMELQIVKSGLDPIQETRFGNFMIEDTNLDNLSYVDYLVAVHKNITAEISASRK